MKNLKQIMIGCCLGLTVVLSSCDPRIAFDETQWGDKAYITSVLLFTLQTEDHKLEEYYLNGMLTPGELRKFISGTSVIVNNNEATVALTVPLSSDLTKVGLVIRHTAEKIEPLSGAPTPGYIADFSLGTFKYRVISADGTTRDWTITIVKK